VLADQQILITGASSGIGKALAEALLKEGATVLGLCRTVENLPSGVRPIPCDLTRREEIESAFAGIEQLDILVNNAGRAHMAPITTGDPALWEEMWQINVQGLALCAQKALPLFPKTGGHILNISSMSGHRVPPSGGFYAATKFAVRAITDALRRRHSPARYLLRRTGIPAHHNKDRDRNAHSGRHRPHRPPHPDSTQGSRDQRCPPALDRPGCLAAESPPLNAMLSVSLLD